MLALNLRFNACKVKTGKTPVTQDVVDVRRLPIISPWDVLLQQRCPARAAAHASSEHHLMAMGSVRARTFAKCLMNAIISSDFWVGCTFIQFEMKLSLSTLKIFIQNHFHPKTIFIQNPKHQPQPHTLVLPPCDLPQTFTWSIVGLWPGLQTRTILPSESSWDEKRMKLVLDESGHGMKLVLNESDHGPLKEEAQGRFVPSCVWLPPERPHPHQLRLCVVTHHSAADTSAISRPSFTGTPMSISRTNQLVAICPPASRQMRAAAFLIANPHLPRTPASAHDAMMAKNVGRDGHICTKGNGLRETQTTEEQHTGQL